MSLLIKGVTNFISLTDTPAAFTDKAGKVAQVNVGEDALEFGTKKLSYSQIYDGAVPASGYLKPLGSIPYRWDKGSTGQRQMFLAISGDYLYVGGGENNSMPEPVEYGNDNFWRYHLANKTWERMANLPAEVAFSGRAAAHNGKIYVVCSQDNEGATYERLFVYDISADSWTSYADVPAGASWESWVCPTTAHLIIISDDLHKLYEIEYGTLDVWNYKCDVAAGLRQAQTISDEVYVIDSDANMKRYDEPTEAFVDTGIAKPPNSLSMSRMWVEDEDAIWVVGYESSVKLSWWRSTGALAFVEQVTRPWGHAIIEGGNGHGVLPSGEDDWYIVYGYVGTPTDLPDGCYGLVEVAGVWELVSQAFIQGDDLIIDAKGVPVHCSVGGELREVVDTYLAMVVIAGETWGFTLSKDYDYHGVAIWRGT